MSRMQFLCDEHVPKGLQAAVKKLDATVEILIVGQAGAPAKTTNDPELLAWAERHRFALLTLDKTTMPGHIRDHLAGGGHTWGIFEFRRGFSPGRLAEEIILLWSASEAEEWLDSFVFLPLT